MTDPKHPKDHSKPSEFPDGTMSDRSGEAGSEQNVDGAMDQKFEQDQKSGQDEEFEQFLAGKHPLQAELKLPEVHPSPEMDADILNTAKNAEFSHKHVLQTGWPRWAAVSTAASVLLAVILFIEDPATLNAPGTSLLDEAMPPLKETPATQRLTLPYESEAQAAAEKKRQQQKSQKLKSESLISERRISEGTSGSALEDSVDNGSADSALSRSEQAPPPAAIAESDTEQAEPWSPPSNFSGQLSRELSSESQATESFAKGQVESPDRLAKPAIQSEPKAEALAENEEAQVTLECAEYQEPFVCENDSVPACGLTNQETWQQFDTPCDACREADIRQVYAGPCPTDEDKQ